MNPGRLIYKTILQISKQYSGNRLPLTGIVGFSQSRFRYPVIHAVKEAFQARHDSPDLDCKFALQPCKHTNKTVCIYKSQPCSHAAGFQAIKQLQAQYAVLTDAGPIEQVTISFGNKKCLQKAPCTTCCCAECICHMAAEPLAGFPTSPFTSVCK